MQSNLLQDNLDTFFVLQIVSDIPISVKHWNHIFAYV